VIPVAERGALAMQRETGVSLSPSEPGNSARGAMLRSLNGADELLLHGERGATAATALLAATVAMEPLVPVTVAAMRELPVGDRERLLLGLYGATFGPTLELLARCPNELTEVEIPIEAGIAPVTAEREPLVVDGLTVHLRLPTGRDQERAAADSADPERAARRLLLDCILGVSGPAGQRVDVSTVFELIADPVAEALRRLDPGAELRTELECPACAARFPALLDGLALIAAAVTPEAALFAEVDTLARAYGWREPDILAIPLARRRRYLALIAERRAE
jgi:hypothetical protein